MVSSTTKNAILVVHLGILGAGMILLATSRFGVGLSPDSVGYIATARHIASGQGAISFDNTPLLVQPPFYPTVLAFLQIVFGLDPFDLARFVNAGLFGAVVALAGFMEFQCGCSRSFSFLAAIYTLAALPIVHVALMAWSELLFIFFVLLFLNSFQSYAINGNLKSLFLPSLFASLACLTRYIGVVLIAHGVICFVFVLRQPWKKRVSHLAFFLLFTIFPFALWLLRNYAFSGTFFGPREPSVFTFSQNVWMASQMILLWYFPKQLLKQHSVITLALFAGIGIPFLKAQKQFFNGLAAPAGMPVLFVILYTGFLIFSSTTTAFDQIDHRLLSPIAVPISLRMFAILYRVWSSSRLSHAPQYLQWLVVGVLTVVFIKPIKSTIGIIQLTRKEGRGYSSQSWRNSPTIAFLSKNKWCDLNDPFFTNEPEALYFLAGLVAQESPRKNMYNSPKVIADLLTLQNTWPPPQGAYLIWFNKSNRTNGLFSLEELMTIAQFQTLATLDDAIIFRVTRHDAP